MLIKTCSSFRLLEAESKRLLTARVLTRHLGHCSLVHTYEVTRPSIILYSLLIVPVGTPAWRAATQRARSLRLSTPLTLLFGRSQMRDA